MDQMSKYLLLFIIVLFQTVQAQNTMTTVTLDSIVVISSKYQKNINELPYSASIINIDKITQSTSQSVPELLHRESGISLVRDGIWGTEVSIRGMNRSNIVVLIDGNRVETANDISARLSMFDINDIDRVEVIKGAASTLYGTGATGGIVNVISKRPNYSDNFFFKGSYNSGYNTVNNNYFNGMSLSTGAQNWTAKLTGAFRKAGNTKTPSGTLNNSQFSDNSLSGLFTLKPFKDQEILLNYQQFKASDVGIPGGYPLFPNNATVRYPEEKRNMFSAEYNINNISDVWRKISAKYYYQYMLRDVENIPHQVQNIPAGNGQPAKRVSVLEISPTAKHRTNGLQLQSDFMFGKSNLLITGFDYWRRTYTGNRTKSQKIEVLNSGTVVNTTYKTIVEKPLPDAGYSSAGIFIQDDIRLIDNRLNLTLGGRFDLINIKNQETINPLYEINNEVINYNPANQVTIWKAGDENNTSYSYSLGLLYRFSENINLTLNAARSFRSPSLEERYQYIDQGSVIRVGNPKLNPEKGYSIDFGFRTNHNNIKTKTSVFYNYLNDLVSEEPGVYESRNAFIKINIGKAELFGFEQEIRYSITPELSVYNSISYVRGKNKKDKLDLPQISPLNGSTGISAVLFNLVEADLTAVYFATQNKTAPGELSTPGYQYFNLNLSSLPLNFSMLDIRFFTGIENILNNEYRNHLSTNRGLITTEPGRNIYAKINISW